MGPGINELCIRATEARRAHRGVRNAWISSQPQRLTLIHNGGHRRREGSLSRYFCGITLRLRWLRARTRQSPAISLPDLHYRSLRHVRASVPYPKYGKNSPFPSSRLPPPIVRRSSGAAWRDLLRRDSRDFAVGAQIKRRLAGETATRAPACKVIIIKTFAVTLRVSASWGVAITRVGRYHLLKCVCCNVIQAERTLHTSR